MKRLALVAAVIAVAACSKADNAATPERVRDHFSVPSDVPQAVPRRTDTEPFPG